MSASSSSVGSLLWPRRCLRSSRKPCARCGKIVRKMRSLSRSPSRLAYSRLPAGWRRASSPGPRPVGLEGGGPQEQPPVAEGLVGVGVAGSGQRLDQIDLVEVRGPGMGLAAVEPPQPAVGHDDPVGSPCVQRRHDAGAGVLFRRVGVVEVGAVEPAIPGVDERRRQLARRRRLLRR